MKAKKAPKTQQMVFETVRRVMIRAKILPRNFPRDVGLSYIEDKAQNWSGIGGYFSNAEGKLHPAIMANMYYNRSMVYLMATYAHEILHIQQYRKNRNLNHGNKFRKDCKRIAEVFGISYYLINGYDGPSKKTANKIGKKYGQWLLTFANRQLEKDKTYQDCDDIITRK